MLLTGSFVVGRAAAADGAESTDSGETPRPARRAARVVLVDAAGAEPELGALLLELLGRQGVAVSIERSERFEPAKLFGADAEGSVRVFVLLRGPREARLYFRGPNGERYLLRTLALSNGLDAVGRELVGQIVESSASALFEASEGISREQATAELLRDERRAETPDADTRAGDAKRAPTPKKDPPTRANTERQPERWEPRLGVSYGAHWLGPDLGVRHGPRVALGLAWRAPLWLAVEVAVERDFEQRFTTPGLDGSVQASSGALLLGGGVTTHDSTTFGLFAGPCAELRRVSAVAREPGVSATPSRNETGGGVRVELRSAWRTPHLELGAALGLEVAFARTHYDLRGPSGQRELASVSPARPGAALFAVLH